AGGELVERVVDEEEVEVAVFVVVEEGGLGGEAFVVEAVFVGFFGEGVVSIIDVKEVCSLGGVGVGRAADIDVEVAVAVDIDHGGAGAPALCSRDAAFFRDVFEGAVAFVEEQAIVDHVAGQEDIGQAVVVDIADGYSAAVVEIDIIEDVEGFAVEEGILEVDAGVVFVEPGKEGGIVGGVTAGGEDSEKGEEANEVAHGS